MELPWENIPLALYNKNFGFEETDRERVIFIAASFVDKTVFPEAFPNTWRYCFWKDKNNAIKNRSQCKTKFFSSYKSFIIDIDEIYSIK